jgi:general secretion pathway protein K
MNLRQERGMALLITLLVVTLLTIIVVEFTYSTEVDSHLTRNALSATQARYLARSGLVFAEIALRTDAEQKAKNPQEFPAAETLADSWAHPVPVLPIAEGFGTAGYLIVDESARFNLNSLAVGGSPIQLEMRKQLFQGILEALGLDPNLLFSVLDWVDVDDQTEREAGGESEFYLGLRPPYQPRQGPFLSLEEVRLVRGFEALRPPEWDAFRSIVTVLPNRELKINVNTAPELLLVAMFSAFGDPSIAQSLISSRGEHPIVSAAELLQIPGIAQLPPMVRSGVLSVRSSIFTIHASGAAGDVRKGIAVTVDRAAGSTRLRTLGWRQEVTPFALTAAGASGEIPPFP